MLWLLLFIVIYLRPEASATVINASGPFERQIHTPR